MTSMIMMNISVVSWQRLNSDIEAKMKCMEATTDQFVFIVSKQYEQWYEKLSAVKKQRILDELSPLKYVLESKLDLVQVMGEFGQAKPICTLQWIGDTIIQDAQFTTFGNGSANTLINGKTCFACDLLPNFVLIRLQSLAKFYSETYGSRSVGAAVHLWFSLKNKGASAYCPFIKPKIHSEDFADATCNGLGSQWDACFPRFHVATGIARIVTPNFQEAWLTCVWSHTSVNKNATFACSNLIHEYLVDATAALNRLDVDHRIVYGTLLGAVRDQNIIPWTPDVDIALVLKQSDEEMFLNGSFQLIPAESNWTLSLTDCDGADHDPVGLRIFASCPVLLKTGYPPNKGILDQRQHNLMKAEFSGPGTKATSYWRKLGYVDIYYPRNLLRFVKCLEGQVWKPADEVTIRNRTYKGLNSPVESSLCYYGADWKRQPSKAINFTNFVDL